MNDPKQQVIVWLTPKGDVTIKSFCTPKDVRTCTFDSQFIKYARYKSLYTKRESLEREAGGKNANVVLALAAETHIIGFGVFTYPHPEERWHKVGPGIMMEIAALEYRTIIIKVFEPYRFKIYQTNEPNICLKTENIFMCRIGKNIAPELETIFKWVRFNIDPSTFT
jgi:acetoin utilization protein AcuA